MGFSHLHPDGSCSHQAWATDLRTGKVTCADCKETLHEGWPAHNYDHVWYWRKKLPERKGQPCRILARGTSMNSILVEFEDGTKTVTSKWAVRPRGS